MEHLIEEDEPRCDRHPECVLYKEDCGRCGGDGHTEPGELYEEDPLWYDEDDTEPCSDCSGRGWFRECTACMQGKPPTSTAPTPSDGSKPR